MFRIVNKRELNSMVTLLEIEAPFVAKKAQAGQFIIFRVDEFSERVPLTIADYDREKGTVTIIFQKVGLSTKLLAAKEIGDTIQDFVGPLGVATEYDGMKKVAVVGGGDVAVDDASFLASVCNLVYLIHRRDQLRAAQVLQDALKDFHNITCIWDTTVEKIGGEQQVQWITLKQTKTAEKYQLDVDGVFIAVGTVPDTGFVKELVDLDEHGYIKAGEDGRTGVSGIYAAGDIRTKELRQIITAAADGANCVNSAQQDLYKR